MIEINEMIMSLPDMTPEQGERLGYDVAECLMNTLPPGNWGSHINSVDIRLTVSASTDHSQLANDIASQIRYQLMNR
jgi:hypothetical protein